MVQASFIMLRTEFHIEVARVSPLFRVILSKECAEVSTMEAIAECVKVIKPSMGSFLCHWRNLRSTVMLLIFMRKCMIKIVLDALQLLSIRK